MTDSDEHELTGRIRQRLERDAAALDELTVARLDAARRRAVATAQRPRRLWLPVLGSAVAAAITVAVLIWQQPPELPVALDELDIMAAGDDLDMIEELDFYDWLDTADTAG